MNNINQQPMPQVDIKPSAGGLYGWSIKKHLGIASLFTFIMFLAMPVVNILYIMQNYVTCTTLGDTTNMLDAEEMKFIFYLSEVFFIPTCIIFSIVLACMLFNYMHSKVAVDTFHALPVKRSSIFLSKYFAGITLLNVPVILTVGITIAIHLIATNIIAPENFDFDTISAMLQFLLMFVLTQTAFFTMAAFVSINTGTIFDMILSLFSINAAWPLLFVMFDSLFASNLYGYTSIIDTEVYFLLSPLARMIASSVDFNLFPIIWWIVFTVGLLFASIFMYNRRKSEVTGKSFAFKPMKFILLIIIPLIAGMIMGSIFNVFVNLNILYLIGFILGSFAAFAIVQIIIARGFKSFAKSLIIYGSTVVGFAVLFIITCTGLFGYESRLPDADKIDEAYIAVSPNLYSGSSLYTDGYIETYSNSYDFYFGEYSDEVTPEMYLQDKEAVQTIYNLHECIVGAIPYTKEVIDEATASSTISYLTGLVLNDDKTVFNHHFNGDLEYDNYGSVYITYKLKNGSTITRSYKLAVNHFNEYFDQLENNLEYNQKFNYAFNRPDTIDSLEFIDPDSLSEHYNSTGKPSYEGFLNYYTVADTALQDKIQQAIQKGMDYWVGDESYFDSSYIDEWGDEVFVKDGLEYYYDQDMKYYYLYDSIDSYSTYVELTNEQAVALLDAYQADLTNELSGNIDQSEPIGTIKYYTSIDVVFSISIDIKPSYKNILSLDFVQKAMAESALEDLQGDTAI